MKIKNYVGFIALGLFASCTQKDGTKFTTFKADEARSAIEWKGSAPTHFHKGAFKLSGQVITNGKGEITGGDFSIPIASISNFDLTNPQERDQLLNHLKSDEFFNIAFHPEAKFHITKVEHSKDPSPSSPNRIVTGNFTMIGQTHSIQFPILMRTTKDSISVEGNVKLNRLQWGMTSYNDPEKGLYILPEVDITLKVYCKRP